MTATHQRDPTRLAEVDLYLTLLDRPDALLDRICARAAREFSVPMATVSFVHDYEVAFVGRYGVGLAGAGAVPGLCVAAIGVDEPYVVPEAPDDAVASWHPLVSGSPGLSFYAAAPITTAAGYRIGTVSVMDLRPRHTTAAEIAVLRELAAEAGRELDARLARGDGA
ncbi:MAG TPA: GAF domain-containing protein [Jiangellaceae bacterium]